MESNQLTQPPLYQGNGFTVRREEQLPRLKQYFNINQYIIQYQIF